MKLNVCKPLSIQSVSLLCVSTRIAVIFRISVSIIFSISFEDRRIKNIRSFKSLQKYCVCLYNSYAPVMQLIKGINY